MLNLGFINILLTAAKFIEEDGVDGFNKASEIVGSEAAAGLLVGSLVAKLNKDQVYPMPDEIPEKITKTLYENHLIKE